MYEEKEKGRIVTGRKKIQRTYHISSEGICTDSRYPKYTKQNSLKQNNA